MQKLAYTVVLTLKDSPAVEEKDNIRTAIDLAINKYLTPGDPNILAVDVLQRYGTGV